MSRMREIDREIKILERAIQVCKPYDVKVDFLLNLIKKLRWEKLGIHCKEQHRKYIEKHKRSI